MKEIISRCSWVKLDKPYYVEYHDKEWGVPVHDDRLHFEMISLEGAQAGLSWDTILRKRANYREVFKNFEIEVVANMHDNYLDDILLNPGIIRNRAKIYSVRNNAKVFLAIQKEFDSFDSYIWNFVNNKPIINNFSTMGDMPARTEISTIISKDLVKRGMKFVGPTIIYSYMQAAGLVNDHLPECYLRHNG